MNTSVQEINSLDDLGALLVGTDSVNIEHNLPHTEYPQGHALLVESRGNAYIFAKPVSEGKLAVFTVSRDNATVSEGWLRISNYIGSAEIIGKRHEKFLQYSSAIMGGAK